MTTSGRPSPGRLLLSVLVALALGYGVYALREATISQHEQQPADSTLTVTVVAEENGAEQSLTELTEARVLTCRLEVQTDPAGPLELLDDGRYRIVMSPALDRSDRKQFRGCMEDWGIDHVQFDVVSMIAAPPGADD